MGTTAIVTSKTTKFICVQTTLPLLFYAKLLFVNLMEM